MKYTAHTADYQRRTSGDCSLDIFEKVNLIPADLVDAGSMVEAVKISDPDEIYHLAA